MVRVHAGQPTIHLRMLVNLLSWLIASDSDYMCFSKSRRSFVAFDECLARASSVNASSAGSDRSFASWDAGERNAIAQSVNSRSLECPV